MKKAGYTTGIKFLLIGVLICLLQQAGCAETNTSQGPNVVEVMAVDYAFAAPDTIPAGWTKFRMSNEGEEEHFMLVNPLPEGTTIEDIRKIALYLQSLHDQHDTDNIDKKQIYETLHSSIGKPSADVPYRGGPGFLSMGHTVEATTYLEPGRYVIECYMRNPEGKQHNVLGMMRELIVAEDSTANTNPPEPDEEIRLTNNGILAADLLKSGRHTFEVHFLEHPAEYIGNDVHLVRLKENTNIDSLARWMDVFEKGGLVAPATVEFLGGTNELPAGEVAYFTVDLEPGNYAWISELDYDSKKWKKFEVEQ